jgi:hypothetical protein
MESIRSAVCFLQMKLISEKFTSLLLICFFIALSGCVPTQFVAGTIHSVAEGRYQQSAVLEFDLVIDGNRYVLRTPAECRSLVNPFSRIRVTEINGNAFEFKLKNGQSAVLSTNYSCSEADASINLNYSQLLSVYRVQQLEKSVITQDWVVPMKNADAAGAPVMLAQMGVDRIRTATNTTVIENLPDALKRLVQIPKNQALVSMFSPQMALDSEIVNSNDSEVLRKFSEPQPLPQDMPKRIVENLNKAGYSRRKISSAELATKRSEIPFQYINSENTFTPNLKHIGTRIFYPIPVEVCKTIANCAIRGTNVRFEKLTMPTATYSFVYSPADELIYIRQSDEF